MLLQDTNEIKLFTQFMGLGVKDCQTGSWAKVRETVVSKVANYYSPNLSLLSWGG